jgi:hypothetical protein
MKSFSWFGHSGLLFMHSVISCILQIVAHMNLHGRVLQVMQGKEPYHLPQVHLVVDPCN